MFKFNCKLKEGMEPKIKGFLDDLNEIKINSDKGYITIQDIMKLETILTVGDLLIFNRKQSLFGSHESFHKKVCNDLFKDKPGLYCDSYYHVKKESTKKESISTFLYNFDPVFVIFLLASALTTDNESINITLNEKKQILLKQLEYEFPSKIAFFDQYNNWVLTLTPTDALKFSPYIVQAMINFTLDLTQEKGLPIDERIPSKVKAPMLFALILCTDLVKKVLDVMQLAFRDDELKNWLQNTLCSYDMNIVDFAYVHNPELYLYIKNDLKIAHSDAFNQTKCNVPIDNILSIIEVVSASLSGSLASLTNPQNPEKPEKSDDEKTTKKRSFFDKEPDSSKKHKPNEDGSEPKLGM